MYELQHVPPWKSAAQEIEAVLSCSLSILSTATEHQSLVVIMQYYRVPSPSAPFVRYFEHTSSHIPAQHFNLVVTEIPPDLLPDLQTRKRLRYIR